MSEGSAVRVSAPHVGRIWDGGELMGGGLLTSVIVT